MLYPKPNAMPSWARTLQIGAWTGVGLTFVYTLVFALYTICRSSISIWVSMPIDMNLLGTLLANATAIILAALASATVLSVLTALFGMCTAAGIKMLNARFNPNCTAARGMTIGLAATLGFVLVFQVVVRMLWGHPLGDLGIETYLFWFGLPAMLHMGAGVLGAWYMLRNVVNVPMSRIKEVNYGTPESYTRAGQIVSSTRRSVVRIAPSSARDTGRNRH